MDIKEAIAFGQYSGHESPQRILADKVIELERENARLQVVWQPIETAPRNEDVMVWNTMAGAYRSRATILAGEDETQWPMCFWGEAGRWWPKPSHWAPLDSFMPNV